MKNGEENLVTLSHLTRHSKARGSQFGVFYYILRGGGHMRSEGERKQQLGFSYRTINRNRNMPLKGFN